MSWVAEVWRTGRAAAADGPPSLDVALLLTIGYESVLVTTDATMGVILTTSGVALRALPSRRRGPGDVPPLLRVQQPQGTIATAVLSSGVPAGGGDRLAELCRGLRSSGDPRKRLRTYQHEFFGETGFDVAVLAFLPGSRGVDGSPGDSRSAGPVSRST
jgi:hypothetical protein